ncbi:hypothetical protein AC481_04915 [miscellaneous Crenarchaeota group archaeon SMTZ-80]|nr:MAG: hypothetical protein AC481_04915 [miscellaneous Crenarchaeota group archaeon SMTZ-80]
MKKNSNIRLSKARIIVYIVVCSIICMIISPAQGANFKKDISRVNTSENKAWTTLYYLDCDYDSNNFDPLEGIFIDEIASTEQVNVVVIQDKEQEPAFLYYIDENHSKIVLEELGEINMGDPQTLSYFIDYGKQNYPADRYLLWAYDHGGGWKGACMDTTNNDPGLTMDELQQALTESEGIDVICFFACLMSSLEAVYELRGLVDVYIGSEDLAWASWWDGICGDTNQLLTSNPDISNEDVGIEIVNSFQEQGHPPTDVLTASAIKADKVEPLVQALDELAKYFIFHWLRSYRNVKTTHDNTFLLADYQGWAEVFEVYDLKGFIEHLPASSKKTTVLDAFNEAVIHEVHGSSMEETHGLSIFFPAHISPYELVQEYKKAGLGLDLPNDTWWNEFLFFFIVTNTILRR